MPEYADRVELFHLLSLENRLRILDELRYGDACVCHLQHKLKKSQAYVSQQLRSNYASSRMPAWSIPTALG